MAKAVRKKKGKVSAPKLEETNVAGIAEDLEDEPSGRDLIVVESPAKAKTLKKYLGRKFDVKASVGHLMDLPKSSLGVDVEKGFQPTYELIRGKQKVMDELVKAAKRAGTVYLASDPDREGEAIAWHVADTLRLPESRIRRVLFHEITKTAVLKALEEPISLNKDRFESQQARRILDRLVGYKISPILWTKVRRGLSAGRVQSVAVRMISDREKEVLAFIPKEYWSLTAYLSALGKSFTARLTKIGEEKLDKMAIENKAQADAIVAAVDQRPWTVQSVTQKQRRRNPDPPFITSTLQQESSRRLYFSAKKTMTLAQQLYEGIDLGQMGTQGLISYMRTDSLRLSDEAVRDARGLIEKGFGKDYLPAAPNIYKNKKNAQDAHEAIRPTSLEYLPEKVKPYLDPDQFKLYELVWRRFLACQMSPAVFDSTTVDYDVAGSDQKKYGFRSTGSILRFDGYLALWKSDDDSADMGESLPPLDEKTPVACDRLDAKQHWTEPPPRFSESSLIRELEEKGIGRPSTYASILTTIQDRKYVEKRENRFYPTELGVLVTDLLIENFSSIVDETFTANMEEELDQIEEGKRNWVATLENFYSPFEKTLKDAQEKMRNVKREETPTDLTCPKCTKPIVLKWGKNGKFAACQGYPDCRFTSEYETTPEGTIKLVEQPTTDEKCPNCSEPMVVKTGRFGRFLACSKYPDCKTTKPITTGIKCPECKEGELTQKRTRFGKNFYSCTRYPECKHALWDKPLKDTKCPQCSHPFLVEKYTKRDGASIKCPSADCGYVQPKSQETPNPATV